MTNRLIFVTILILITDLIEISAQTDWTKDAGNPILGLGARPRGVAEIGDSADTCQKVAQAASDLLEQASWVHQDWADTKAKLGQLVSELVYKETGRRPMIVVVTAEV